MKTKLIAMASIFMMLILVFPVYGSTEPINDDLELNIYTGEEGKNIGFPLYITAINNRDEPVNVTVYFDTIYFRGFFRQFLFENFSRHRERIWFDETVESHSNFTYVGDPVKGIAEVVVWIFDADDTDCYCARGGYLIGKYFIIWEPRDML